MQNMAFGNGRDRLEPAVGEAYKEQHMRIAESA